MKESAVESVKHDDQRSEAIIQGISARITQKQFETWFRTIRLTFTPPEKVHFAVPNRFHKKWIENHYTNVIIETVRQLANVTPAITIGVDPALRSMFAS
jgi:chromosomal replication initiation ATPase DnaA